VVYEKGKGTTDVHRKLYSSAMKRKKEAHKSHPYTIGNEGGGAVERGVNKKKRGRGGGGEEGQVGRREGQEKEVDGRLWN